MKIGIYFNDKNQQNRDCSHPELGNNRFGGIEYEVLMLIHALTEKQQNVTVFHYHINNRIDSLAEESLIEDELDVLTQAKNHMVEVLITPTILQKQWYEDLRKKQIPTIIWAGNYLHYYGEWLERELAQNPFIRKVVCVSRGMYETYLTKVISEKMTWINYMVPASAYPERSEYEPWITYVGGLYPQKGFQILAYCWKHLLKICPEAQLHVIGSGQLYEEGCRLGKYQLAEEAFEQEFIQYLIDEDGQILPSVTFHGNMGPEKSEIISKSAVGVVNPSGETETFCISAAEFSACQVPVITKDVIGITDTVKDWITGILYRGQDYGAFVASMEHLLRHPEKNWELGRNGRCLVELEFSIEKNREKWLTLLRDTLQKSKKEIKQPLVSVIIPTYNRIHTIQRAIDSVLQQTYKNIELIIVDDGSTDGTQELVCSKYGEYENMQYILNEKNLGVGGARNAGVRYSNGTYIAFQDSDDAWLPDKLEIQMQVLLRNDEEDVGMVYSQIRVHWENGIKQEFPSKLIPSKSKDGNILDTLLLIPMISTQTMVLRKDYFESMGGFNEDLKSIEDYEFSVRFAKRYPIVFCDEPLVAVYETAGSVNKQSAAKIVTSCYMLQEFAKDYLERNLILDRMTDLYQEAKRNGVLSVLEQCMVMLQSLPEFQKAYQQVRNSDLGGVK